MRWWEVRKPAPPQLMIHGVMHTRAPKLRKNTTSGTGIAWVSARMSTFMPANAAPAMIMRAAPRNGAGTDPQRVRIGAARAAKDERITGFYLAGILGANARARHAHRSGQICATRTHAVKLSSTR